MFRGKYGEDGYPDDLLANELVLFVFDGARLAIALECQDREAPMYVAIEALPSR
jgi:hypothetical protein